jgi:hypothetical protein
VSYLTSHLAYSRQALHAQYSFLQQMIAQERRLTAVNAATVQDSVSLTQRQYETFREACASEKLMAQGYMVMP